LQSLPEVNSGDRRVHQPSSGQLLNRSPSLSTEYLSPRTKSKRQTIAELLVTTGTLSAAANRWMIGKVHGCALKINRLRRGRTEV
jgi:hypothetical protein